MHLQMGKESNRKFDNNIIWIKSVIAESRSIKTFSLLMDDIRKVFTFRRIIFSRNYFPLRDRDSILELS